MSSALQREDPREESAMMSFVSNGTAVSLTASLSVLSSTRNFFPADYGPLRKKKIRKSVFSDLDRRLHCR